MIETLLASSKIKALLTAVILIILGYGFYGYSTVQPVNVQDNNYQQNIDPYISTIQQRAEHVDNAVYDVRTQRDKQVDWEYKQTVENTIIYIQNRDLEARQEHMTLTPNEKNLNEAYQKYLHEAFVVVADCYNGEKPDLSKMQKYRDGFNNTNFQSTTPR